MTLMFFKFGLKALKQGEGVGGGTGKTSQDLAVLELAHLAGRAFNHNIAQGNLPVAANGHLHTLRGFASHTDDGCTVKLFHTLCKLGHPAQNQV
jgi:hypothetical protein